ncbi:MAG: hypothetical protein HYR96_07845 [Deltaproteobacteria bacterium]|nr:hypothetical protein [Deltaproteobacteria bacterium]MBI3294494.1 hypothetical protein [Deltaproteobacteria bacterium]
MNEKGNITLMVISGLFISGVGLAYIMRALPQYQRIEKSSSDLVAYQAALSSSVGYMTHAIRERWCLNEQGTQTACSTNIQTWATDSRNTERLLISQPRLSDSQFGLNVRLGRPIDDQDAILGTTANPFSFTVPLAQVTETHPLFVAIRPILGQVLSIRFDVMRVSNINLPQNGNEIFLKIRTTLLLDRSLVARGLSVLGRKSDPYLESVAGFFPREVSTFALFVAGDMHLDSQNGAGGQGDFYVPSYIQKSAVPATTSGLIFSSPVFVNGNLVVSASKLNGGDGLYNATTFGDSLYFGGGMVLENQKGKLVATQPSTAGGVSDQFYSQLTAGFGGLLQGTAKDIGRDRGLDYLFRTNAVPGPEATPDATLMQACVDRNKMQTDLAFSSKSTLVVTAIAATTPANNPTYQYRFALTYRNVFEDQLSLSTGVSFLNQPGIKTATNFSAANSLPIARVTVNFPFPGQAAVVNAEVARDSVVRIEASDPADRALAATPAVLTIRFSPVVLGGNIQPDQLSVSVAFESTASINVGPTINLMAYEYGSNGAGGSLRDASNQMVSNNVALIYGKAAPSQITPTTTVQQGIYVTANPNGSVPVTQGIPDGTDFSILVTQCQSGGRVADYDYDFSTVSRKSWLFAPITDPATSAVIPTLTMSSSDYNKAQLTATIQATKFFPWKVFTQIAETSPPSSINVGQCVIPSTADFVTGFYVCDKLTIAARAKPLRIIGTFIVGSTNIDRSAIDQGILWSSIYNPSAIDELKQVGILGQGSSCDTLNQPAWSPALSDKDAAQLYVCNPNALRVADPFRWTMTDPDCGLISGGTSTTCKKHPMRYTVKVLSTGGNI